MARREDGSWSAPSAIGVTGVGYGFVMGASMRHLIYLIRDEWTLKSLSGNVGVTLGTKIEAAAGTWGRSSELTTILTNKGLGTDIWLHCSQGLFSGFSTEGALCNPRSRVNEKFYGEKVSPAEILFDDAVQIPDGTLLPAVYAKLKALCSGKSICMINVYMTENDQHTNNDESIGAMANEEEETAQIDVTNEEGTQKATAEDVTPHSACLALRSNEPTKIESIRVFGDAAEHTSRDEEIQHAVFLDEIRRHATEEGSCSVVFLDSLVVAPSGALGTERGSSLVSPAAA